MNESEPLFVWQAFHITKGQCASVSSLPWDLSALVVPYIALFLFRHALRDDSYANELRERSKYP